MAKVHIRIYEQGTGAAVHEALVVVRVSDGTEFAAAKKEKDEEPWEFELDAGAVYKVAFAALGAWELCYPPYFICGKGCKVEVPARRRESARAGECELTVFADYCEKIDGVSHKIARVRGPVNLYLEGEPKEPPLTADLGEHGATFNLKCGSCYRIAVGTPDQLACPDLQPRFFACHGHAKIDICCRALQLCTIHAFDNCGRIVPHATCTVNGQPQVANEHGVFFVPEPLNGVVAIASGGAFTTPPQTVNMGSQMRMAATIQVQRTLPTPPVQLFNFVHIQWAPVYPDGAPPDPAVVFLIRMDDGTEITGSPGPDGSFRQQVPEAGNFRLLVKRKIGGETVYEDSGFTVQEPLRQVIPL